jgi:hypothetical protein
VNDPSAADINGGMTQARPNGVLKIQHITGLEI